MKKILLIGLLLMSACQSLSDGQGATPEPTSSLIASTTRATPTLVPATDTPTVVPSPTVTATPLPPERYFTEEFDAPLIHWSTLYASGHSDRVEVLNKDSKLTFELYSPVTWMYTIYSPFEYARVRIETRIESLGSQANSMGLVCHYNEQEGWYEFNISNDGSYSVLYGEWLGEGIAAYTPIIDGTSERILTGNSINEISLDCYDNLLKLYINGNPLRNINVEHIGLTSGKVGLSLGSFEEVPVILSFDWVDISEP